MSWNDTLRTMVVQALAAKPSTFAELLGSLPNVYPTDLKALLDELRKQGYETPSFSNGDRHHPTDLHLPTPHPLDYEWRYTTATRTDLSRLINEVTPHGTIVLLGTPSLYLSHAGHQDVHLIDANAALWHYVQPRGNKTFHCVNLLTDQVPELQVNLVVADPPWYPEHLAAFVIVASRLLTDGGVLLLSLPGAGTRPSIGDELASMHDLASKAGLKHQATTTGVLAYETPPFEENALRAAGISVHTPWRHGDLARFTKVGACEVAHDVPPSEHWIEYALGSVRIRARAATSDQLDDPRLVPLVSGDILPTVSRRDERRSQALVWTSGNRIYTTLGLAILHVILNALQHDLDPLEAVRLRLDRQLDRHEEKMVTEAASQVRELVSAEAAENHKRQASAAERLDSPAAPTDRSRTGDSTTLVETYRHQSFT